MVHVHGAPDLKGHNCENVKQKLRRIGVDVPHRGGKGKRKR
jgi:hypothetical protein